MDRRQVWVFAYWVLLAGWMLGAGLSMAQVDGGFATNYLADLMFPPWYYIVTRDLASRERRGPFLLRWFGRSPERAAISIFVVGVASELSQRYWPGRVIAGTYDPWDIVAYAVGLGVCYGCDWRVTSAEHAARTSD